MSSTDRLKPVTRPEDLGAVPELREFFASMPHYGAVPGRASVDGWDPLSTEGPRRAVWRLTGYRLAGLPADGVRVFVLRVAVDGGRPQFVAARTGGPGGSVVFASDEQPARERSRDGAEARAVQETAAARRAVEAAALAS